jgi:hypothetical protein
MMRRVLAAGAVAAAVAAAAAVAPQVARAQALVAEYWSDSGSVEPAYAWNLHVTFRDDGSVAVRRCKGYETEGPGCRLGKGKVSIEVLNSIRDAADAAGLARNPPGKAPFDEIPIGGGSDGGAVWWQGEKIMLWDFPAQADAARVATVVAAIRAAIPQRLARRFIDVE